MAGLEQYLFKAMNILIEQKNFPFDITKRGRIVASPTSGVYVVSVQDTEYKVRSKFNFTVGESVLVLFPQGNSNDLYIYPNK